MSLTGSEGAKKERKSSLSFSVTSTYLLCIKEIWWLRLLKKNRGHTPKSPHIKKFAHQNVRLQQSAPKCLLPNHRTPRRPRPINLFA